MTMPPLFLSDNELEQLTARKRKGCQIGMLKSMGVPFRINAAGRPVVCRSAVEGTAAAHNPPDQWTSNVITRHGQ